MNFIDFLRPTPHPNPKTIRKLCDQLQAFAYGNGHHGPPTVDMGATDVRYRPGSGTCSCLGGWFALMKEYRGSKKEYRIIESRPRLTDELVLGQAVGYKRGKRRLYFTHGAQFFSRKLGFKEAYDLCEWAKRHPSLWGNDNGEYMWGSSKAYSCGPFSCVPLSKVLHHWREVADRIEYYEKHGDLP